MNLPVMPPFLQKCCNQFEYVHHQIGELPNVNTSRRIHPVLSNVQLRLHNRELWQQFHKETTEMIITKVGRRMFPHLQLSIDGLQENVNYCILVEMESVSSHRHKYCGSNTFDENGNKSGNSGGWTKAGQAESQPNIEHRIYLHPDSPARGVHWMKHVVNFNRLKVTNNTDRGFNVLLTSMHKYVPKIWIFQSDYNDNFNKLCSQPHSFFIFKETEFIAVTAYQNEKITKLKINNNPFAKGFRDTGHSRCKRKQGDATGYPNQMNDEDSNSSSETGPLPPRALLLKTDVLHNVTNTGTVPGQDLTHRRVEDNHLNARPSAPCYVFHRPWLDPPRSSVDVHLPPLPLSLPLPTLPDLPLYNFQFPAPGLIPHGFVPPTPSQYQHFGYSNIRDWQGTMYHMPWHRIFQFTCKSKI
ncbi:T-box transcription factor TBX3-like isoform X2 [Odontomachus brunneus]|uniref:T-box transcription factor TBX3-like isoform X2 n=1 Tax=Odontomachus brunneus TaxID=486640 RepID=UPI0013F278ED|nr:T-box transcription factor TBX3-like isoform X2 [Odontomachus brunneus]